jgi:hypothetical protein
MTAVSHLGHIACEAITEEIGTRSTSKSGEALEKRPCNSRGKRSSLGDTTDSLQVGRGRFKLSDPVKSLMPQFSKYVGGLDDAYS